MKSTDKRWDNVKLWLDALRSGKYKQRIGTLHSKNNEFCCLGVACNVYQKQIGDLRKSLELSLDNEEVYSYDNNTDVLPQKVVNWLGIKSNHGAFFQEDSFSIDNLIYLNDNGFSFKEIAAFIESNPPDLFVE